jgi:energy-coupling factor transport system ATP-binding protein
LNIRIDDLSFQYPSGVEALRDIDLRITNNQSLAIVGENGAGKTTLVKHLNGLLQPSAGEVMIGDWNTQEHTVAQLARRVGYVFQNPDDQLFARTVRAEVAFGPKNLGLSPAEIDTRVEGALQRTNLKALSDHHPYDLHAAKRKLVAIAATMAMDTPIIIFDEPTTGQDAHGIATIGSIIKHLRSQDRTIIAISHDLDFCAEHFERIIVMSQGRIVADNDPERVFIQEELLRESGLEAPQIARLARAMELNAMPLTAEAFVEAWLSVREAKET